MTRILFICHGNICRSPMAEYIMKELVKKAHREHEIYVESAATSREELGNPVYPPARRELMSHGIDPSGHHARQMTWQDAEEFDLLIPMERYNVRNMQRFLSDETRGKVHLLRDYTDKPGDIDDPWYTGDFGTAYRQIEAGCRGLLEKI
ncbi:MAG: low molecular weight phosphotyrosine protein phosphatase [Lachnospiraceae bacterium]|nr:low molecular weight phosphotyrosine protein phosphatase [Lachnospiraceae bacterium]